MGGEWRGGREGARSGAEALPVPGFRLRVPEDDPRPEGGAAARRDFQTRTMASSWWRWRHGCSWRPAARIPGPGSPGRTGPPGPHPAAAVRAQVRRRSAPGEGGRRGHGAMTAAGNEWARAARAPCRAAPRGAPGICLPTVGARRLLGYGQGWRSSAAVSFCVNTAMASREQILTGRLEQKAL